MKTKIHSTNQLLALIAKTKKRADLNGKEDTQELRKNMIADLQEMFRIAKKNAVTVENSGFATVDAYCWLCWPSH
jgi:hypothetical protein